MKPMSDISNTITITQQEYEQLLKAQDMLIALQASGVDTWRGYYNAVRLLKRK